MWPGRRPFLYRSRAWGVAWLPAQRLLAPCPITLWWWPAMACLRGFVGKRSSAGLLRPAFGWQRLRRRKDCRFRRLQGAPWTLPCLRRRCARAEGVQTAPHLQRRSQGRITSRRHRRAALARSPSLWPLPPLLPCGGRTRFLLARPYPAARREHWIHRFLASTAPRFPAQQLCWPGQAGRQSSTHVHGRLEWQLQLPYWARSRSQDCGSLTAWLPKAVRPQAQPRCGVRLHPTLPALRCRRVVAPCCTSAGRALRRRCLWLKHRLWHGVPIAFQVAKRWSCCELRALQGPRPRQWPLALRGPASRCILGGQLLLRRRVAGCLLRRSHSSLEATSWEQGRPVPARDRLLFGRGLDASRSSRRTRCLALALGRA